MTILTDDEIAKAGKDCFWPLDEDAPKFARAVEAAVLAKLARQEPVVEIPPELDVRRILLSVVPGDDGMGHEICATNVADVEKKLGELWSELEEWQLGIRRLPAAPEAPAQGNVK